MQDNAGAGAHAGGDLVLAARQNDEARVSSVYEFECVGPDGQVKWTEKVRNLVTNAGLNDLLDKMFKGSAYTAAWYVGLKGAGTPVAADTMASHASWAEIAGYDEATREVLTLGSVSGQSVSNTASKASFAINATATVAGAFINSIATKSGTTGTLYSVADFASSRAVLSGDVLNVTVTLTTASA